MMYYIPEDDGSTQRLINDVKEFIDELTEAQI